jgi:hypothetical protein
LTVITEEKEPSDDTENYNATQRFMVTLSGYLLRFRWPLLVLSVISFGLSCYFATKLSQPEYSDVRLLKPGIQYEQASFWRTKILSNPQSSGVSSPPITGNTVSNEIM